MENAWSLPVKHKFSGKKYFLEYEKYNSKGVLQENRFQKWRGPQLYNLPHTYPWWALIWLGPNFGFIPNWKVGCKTGFFGHRKPGKKQTVTQRNQHCRTHVPSVLWVALKRGAARPREASGAASAPPARRRGRAQWRHFIEEGARRQRGAQDPSWPRSPHARHRLQTAGTRRGGIKTAARC